MIVLLLVIRAIFSEGLLPKRKERALIREKVHRRKCRVLIVEKGVNLVLQLKRRKLSIMLFFLDKVLLPLKNDYKIAKIVLNLCISSWVCRIIVLIMLRCFKGVIRKNLCKAASMWYSKCHPHMDRIRRVLSHQEIAFEKSTCASLR